MNLEAEKNQIISEIKNIDEEWLILALKKLLDIQEIPSHHQHILEERLPEYETKKDDLQDWDSVKNSL
jgi:hypothetical protein